MWGHLTWEWGGPHTVMGVVTKRNTVQSSFVWWAPPSSFSGFHFCEFSVCFCFHHSCLMLLLTYLHFFSLFGIPFLFMWPFFRYKYHVGSLPSRITSHFTPMDRCTVSSALTNQKQSFYPINTPINLSHPNYHYDWHVIFWLIYCHNYWPFWPSFR